MSSVQRTYADAAPLYREAGWRGVLPLPPGRKASPPPGFTGNQGLWPTDEEVEEWREGCPDGNVALRVPMGVTGIDVDAHKVAGAVEALEALCGPLPSTWVSSARQEPSGIYWYRTPLEAVLMDRPVDGVEVIKFGHRYGVIPPSIHPDLDTPYGWSLGRPGGTRKAMRTAWPQPSGLTEMPEVAVLALSSDRPEAEARDRAPIGLGDDDGAVADRQVAGRLQQALHDLNGNGRHDATRGHVLALVRLAEEGCMGVPSALKVIHGRFIEVVGPERPGGSGEASREFERLVDGGVDLAERTEPPGVKPIKALELPGDDDHQAEVDEPKFDFINGRRAILEQPEGVPAVWGVNDEVLWAEGEPFLLVAPPGVGKTTLMGQVIKAMLGLSPDVLGWPVAERKRVLYLASDRPRQIFRSLRRQFGHEHEAVLEDRLIIWRGPPPKDLAQHTDLLIEMCREAKADVVILDSLKDMAIGLTDDVTGAGLNQAIQKVIAAGIEVGALHHQRKGQNGVKPKTLEDVYGSTWITAGAGSVVLLWGTAGDPVVELVHLKQPAGEVGPLKIEHDHDAGRSTVNRGTDLLAYLRGRGRMGTTVEAAARLVFDKTTPSENDRKKARRKLDRLVAEGKATVDKADPGGPKGTAPAVYRALGGLRIVTSDDL